MPDGSPLPDLAVGAELSGPTRPLTMERVEWYSIGMLSAASGVRQGVQRNIHTDQEYAASQGLPAAIADGMHSTNWLSAMMAHHFGGHYLTSGELRTKYIKPVFVDTPLTPRGVVTAREEGPDGVTYRLDVWCEDADGVKLTVGDAAVTVTASVSVSASAGGDA
ncbi:MaoC family dehydratase [Streptomyces sp. SBT349]|uniref:MaoC family dehydratase n=1 Tax=Streptomyces sp. SBT349 TaxID=1580539 RepID=UPI00066E193D|nr:MaoC family dehydratase [Streptomyces sp. SBT349]